MKTVIIRMSTDVIGDYPVFNAVVVNAKYAESPESGKKYFNIGFSGDVTCNYGGEVSVMKNNFPDGTEMEDGFTIPSFTALYASNNNGILVLNNKANITSIFLGKDLSLNIRDVAGCQALTSLSIANGASTGDVSLLKGLTSLTEIKVQETTIGGEIKELGSCISLTSLISYGSQIHGKIEELVAEFRKNGRTTGTLTGSYGFGTRVSFNGLYVDTNNFPPSSGGGAMNLSWDATTITLNNVTITA